MNKEIFIKELATLAGGTSPFDENSDEPSFYVERRLRWMVNHKEDFLVVRSLPTTNSG